MISKERECFLRKEIAVKELEDSLANSKWPISAQDDLCVCQGGIGWDEVGEIKLEGVSLHGFMNVKQINIYGCMWFIHLHHYLQLYLLSVDFLFFFPGGRPNPQGG